MANFKPLIALTIEHNYFVGGLCKNTLFLPTALTKEVLQKYEILMKPTGFGLTLLVDIEHAAWDGEDISLRFEIYSTDLYFSTYTALPVEKGASLLYSTSLCEPDSAIMIPQSRAPEEFAADTKKKVLNAPVFVVDVVIGATDFARVHSAENDASKQYQIQLQARALHWKYYFFGELANLELDIHDASVPSINKFDVCMEQVAKNGKAYISQELILLHEAPTQRFQLKDKGNSGKVLIKRLPNASVQLLGKGRNSSGQSVLVSEIYINQ